MRRLLIISPYFPPANTADMQRVRMSLPYFAENGWQAEVVTVDPRYVDLPKDELLSESIPGDIVIHRVKAFSKKTTSRIGIGSIAYRSAFQIRKKVNKLLRAAKYDLIYFSTTQFQVCIMGAYWKKKYDVPYVIDFQDPWHSEYYRDKPKTQRPPKYRLLYLLNKYLESLALKSVSGIISVSESYIDALKNRYPQIRPVPAAVITFGAFKPDNIVASKHADEFVPLLNLQTKNIVYIGRGGMDMHRAVKPVFEAVKNGQKKDDRYQKLKFYFIGTSYAPAGEGQATILPLAAVFGLENQVIEITGRIGYYHTLATLQQADALFIPGSDDPQYTASKIYPYLLSGVPLLAVFSSFSSAIGILSEFGVENVFSFDMTADLEKKIERFLDEIISGDLRQPVYNEAAVEKYSARTMTRKQCELFNSAIFTHQ